MAAWSLRTYPDLKVGPEVVSDLKCPLPSEDYYVHQDRGIGTDDDIYNLVNDGPIARCMVEHHRKVFVERNLLSHLSSVNGERVDFYRDEQVELSTLVTKPPAFIIFGKPGIGNTTIAQKMVEYLNSIYISPEAVCEYYRRNFLPEFISPGQVVLGEEVPSDSMLYQLIHARMIEPDVQHRGYVLEGVPRMAPDTESDLDLQTHLDYIMSLQPRPDYMILPFMQDVDLFKRRSEQKIDFETGQMYTRAQYVNKKIEPLGQKDEEDQSYQQKKRKQSLDIGSDAEYEGLTSMVYTQLRSDLTTTKNNEYNGDDLVAANAIQAEVLNRLVTRDEDSPYMIEESLKMFRDWLPYLQAFVDTFDVRKVLEVNAYWAPPIIMRMIIEFLDNQSISPAPLPVHLANEVAKPKMKHFLRETEQMGEHDDGESPFPREPEEQKPVDWPAMLKACTVRNRVDPRFRWRISRWKNLCPVALKDGHPLDGKPEWAVGFLDKIYFLSSKEAYQQFLDNPRPFLLPCTPINFLLDGGHPLTDKTMFCQDQSQQMENTDPYEEGVFDENEYNEETGEIYEYRGEEEGEGAGGLFLPNMDRLASIMKEKEEEKEHIPHVYISRESYLNDKQSMTLFGDVKDYCAIMLYDLGLLRKGSPKFACKFRDRVYYMSSEECLDRFMADPEMFLPPGRTSPPTVPPPRICITGSPACGQEEVGLEMSKQYGIYYFNFRQRLHEIIRVQLGKHVGPGKISETLPGPDGRGSLLGLQESDSSFEVPNLVLDGESLRNSVLSPPPPASNTMVIPPNEYRGEGEYVGEEGPLFNATLISEQEEPNENIFECPFNIIQRAESVVEKDWNKIITSIEQNIKDFLENGDQLPEEVLNEFIAPLWLEEPFKSKGFIMVGFPNTEEDVKYMVKHNLVPEFVHVLDCKPKTMKNRLIAKTVDDWHFKHPTKEARKFLAKASKDQVTKKKRSPKKTTSTIFNSHVIEKHETEGYLEAIEREVLLSKMAWNYNDETSSDIADSLYQYHYLYSKDLHKLKVSLHSNRIGWKTFHTDYSLETSKSELKACLTSSLKFRSSMFESTYVLRLHEATRLLDRGFFQISKFGTWCPVQLSKGNTAINLWNGPGTKKVPILHRQYIYYIAGEENVDQFRENVWDLIQQKAPTTHMPLFMVVTGPPKSGKTLLAQKLAYKLGLVYISEETMLDEVSKHSLLNKVSEDYDFSATKLTNGPQAMVMADEILSYLRDGYAVPPYMVSRVLDLALMAPRAQFHGVVFDNYPSDESLLQELLQRGIIASVVVNLKMELAETIARCERHHFDPNFNYDCVIEEGSALVEILYEESQTQLAPILEWWRNETQSVFDVDATEHPTAIYEKVIELVSAEMAKIQRYIYNHQHKIPAILEGTTPLISRLHTKLAREFGYYDSVALNEDSELVAVSDYNDLTKVVEYRNELYVFSTPKHVQMFLNQPEKYSWPSCELVPPEILPSRCMLALEEMEKLREYWGFQDFDPILYYEGNFQVKCLKLGDVKYCAEYNGKLYFFINEENLDKFMKKPYKYCDIPMPAKFPTTTAEDPLDTVSPPGYIIAIGLSQELCRMLSILASKRPRFPFMSTAKSGLLYTGYYLKTLNMKSPVELRNHYRRAMTHVTSTQLAVEKLCPELNELHGKRSIPPETKKKLDLLMELAEKPDDQKVVDPRIHSMPFSYEAAIISEEHTPNIDLLNEILVNANDTTEEAEEDQNIGHAHTRNPSMQSIIDNFVPPPYLEKNKLY